METPDGGVGFVDQEDIPDDELLYRRIPPPWIDWNSLDASGRPRIRRAAFQDYPAEKAREMGMPGPCMSVGLASILNAHDRQPTQLLEGWGANYGIASLRAGDARQLEQGVMRWPTEDEPWHGVVFTKIGSKKTGGTQNALAQAASWVEVPDRPQ